jgi:hypothetical protein
MDLKYDMEFDRLASVSGGFAQVTQLLDDDGGEYFPTLHVTIRVTCTNQGILKTMVPSPTPSQYNVVSIHCVDEGASVLVCTLETHKVYTLPSTCMFLALTSMTGNVTQSSHGPLSGQSKFVVACTSSYDRSAHV